MQTDTRETESQTYSYLIPLDLPLDLCKLIVGIYIKHNKCFIKIYRIITENL